ncbi:unnamed protein product [Peronospora destructor]|uniref:Uncharacterized protein n=1 Tax=Peronospora destructor TaxID=86335 RepID=A0AAV0TLS8_9STRA|nr:unnamed protein product [Peronospora destructor]
MEDKLVVKNSDRLRKLHRRFSSQKPSTKLPQRHMQGSGSGSSGSSSSSYRTSGKGSSSFQRTNCPGARTISNEDDATKSFFTDNQLFFFHFLHMVLRLKVVAKFLGYLRFSPQWQVTSSISQLSEHNAAFKVVEREGIDMRESTR